MRDPRKAIVAQGYDSLGQDYMAWASGIRDDPRERMLAEFSARMAPGARVLDLGCGTGLPSTNALAGRFVVTGIDISEGQIQAVRHNVPEASFIHADMAQIEFEPESFDGVTAFYAISHLPRDEHGRLFQRIARWLVPDGLFLVTLGANDSPDWIGEWLGSPMFFSAYDADTNRRLLADAGFESLIDEVIETIEPDGPVPFLWILAVAVKD